MDFPVTVNFSVHNWNPVFSDEQQCFFCQSLSAVFLPLCGRGGGVMGGGLLPSICCDGRLGYPEGVSAWPDRNHHWSVWHQASPQLRVLIRLPVDPQSRALFALQLTAHPSLLLSVRRGQIFIFLCSVWTRKAAECMEVTEHDEESPFMKITEVMGSRVGFKMNSKILMTLLKGWLFPPPNVTHNISATQQGYN